jgi:hypothetical protein
MAVLAAHGTDSGGRIRLANRQGEHVPCIDRNWSTIYQWAPHALPTRWVMTQTFPPRLHILLASKSPRALVIRRGPSKQVCTIAWNRNNDDFEIGQWLKGRIYERRSDLSPDGQHFIYFAMNGKWKSEARGSWTAISRAPFLKAIGLWSKGDCWHGGGLFLNDKSFWINDGYGHQVMQTPKGFSRIDRVDGENVYGGECLGVYYLRLQRDGWTLKLRKTRKSTFDTFEKSLRGGWKLRKLAFGTVNHPPGKGCYYDEHALLPPDSSTPIDRKDWEWADADNDRLYWCTDGKLFAAPMPGSGPKNDEAVELFDFRPLKFEAIAAPY